MKPNILFLDMPIEHVKNDFLKLCNETEWYSEADIIYTHMTKLEIVSPRLKLVICPCTGISHLGNLPCHIKIIFLDDKKFLYNFVHSTAEYTIFSMLKMIRKDKQELYHMRVGLIGGAGRIGQQVCDKLYGLTKYPPLIYDIVELEQLDNVKCIQVATMKDLISQSDIISIHLPENMWTYNIIDEEAISDMIVSGVQYLINSSRSAVLSPSAMMKHAHKFRGVTLDVVESYTNEEQIELWRNSNVSLTHHTAGSMKPSRIQTDIYVFNRFKEWLSSQPKEETVTISFNGVEYGDISESKLEKFLDDIKREIKKGGV